MASRRRTRTVYLNIESLSRTGKRHQAPGFCCLSGYPLIVGVACIAVLDENSGKTHEIVADLLRSGCLKRNAQRITLPGRRSAGGLRMVLGVPCAELFGQQWFSPCYLCNHREELASAGRKPTVGGVIAEPDNVGNGWIVIRQLDRRDVSCNAVNQ